MNSRSLTLLPLTLLAACAVGRSAGPVPAPLAPSGRAYEVAAKVELPKTAPEEFEGLHNIYHLSDDIISGGEPEGDEAFQKLQEMGVKTILSVDGKEPDHETAARYGLRYVHVPIRYNGIEDDELTAIAKTFRELDGPFFVHCFHGQHRGPAAAAVGRVVLDGATREQAVAEMRQWCGTSEKYEGLYATIAYGDLPDAEKTKASDFDFPEAHRLTGFRTAMIELPRSWDVVMDLSKRDWQPKADHPDASARNEAAKAAEIFHQTLSMERTQKELDEFRGWLERSEGLSRELVQLLDKHAQGDAAAGEKAKEVAGQVKKICSECHEAYRN